MNKTEKQELNRKVMIPFLVMVIGIVVMIIGMFLPYMTAVGDMAEYIEAYPDRVEIEELDLTAGDLANIPVISVSKIITGVYGEDDGAIANVIVLVFGGFLALTALFVVLKKPIPAMIFDLLTCGVFAFLNFLMNEDFIDPDKYAWGIGYYVILIAVAAVFAGAVWMLIKKSMVKREFKAAAVVQSEE